jgi:hypothetical protein
VERMREYDIKLLAWVIWRAIEKEVNDAEAAE